MYDHHSKSCTLVHFIRDKTVCIAIGTLFCAQTVTLRYHTGSLPVVAGSLQGELLEGAAGDASNTRAHSALHGRHQLLWQQLANDHPLIRHPWLVLGTYETFYIMHLPRPSVTAQTRQIHNRVCTL